MFFDEALQAIRLDDRLGMPVKRYMTRSVEEWQGKRVVWTDGTMGVGIDFDRAHLPFRDLLISIEDMSASDWEVRE